MSGPLLVTVVGETVAALRGLAALAQHDAGLHVACAEGWSASDGGPGPRVRDVLAAAGVVTDRP